MRATRATGSPIHLRTWQTRNGLPNTFTRQSEFCGSRQAHYVPADYDSLENRSVLHDGLLYECV